jgi:hypothetical protein
MSQWKDNDRSIKKLNWNNSSSSGFSEFSDFSNNNNANKVINDVNNMMNDLHRKNIYQNNEDSDQDELSDYQNSDAESYNSSDDCDHSLVTLDNSQSLNRDSQRNDNYHDRHLDRDLDRSKIKIDKSDTNNHQLLKPLKDDRLEQIIKDKYGKRKVLRAMVLTQNDDSDDDFIDEINDIKNNNRPTINHGNNQTVNNNPVNIPIERNPINFTGNTVGNNKKDKDHSGKQGPQGERGIKGDDGIPGKEGRQGKDGVQGKEGSRGHDGTQGPRGPIGIGKDGDPGKDGKQGPQGERGIQGLPGTPGTQGDRGYQGEKGVKGEQGIQGPVGPKGEKGEKGDKGDQGEKGEKGDQGISSLKTYEIVYFDLIGSTSKEHNSVSYQTGIMLDQNCLTCVTGFNNIGNHTNQIDLNTANISFKVKTIQAKLIYHNGKSIVGYTPDIKHEKNSSIFTLKFTVSENLINVADRLLNPMGTLTICYNN